MVKACDQSGFTLIEVLVATAVVTVAVMGLLAVFPGLMNLSRVSRETQIAVSAARSEIDEMRTAPFPDPFDLDSPNILNLYQNVTFTAVGLDQSLGRVTFLSENEAHSVYGMNLDLDLDGHLNETEAANERFVAYPIRVEVGWRDETACTRTVPFNTIIYNLNK